MHENWQQIRVYDDAHWARDTGARKSTSSSFITEGGFLSNTSVQLQESQALSSGESAFHALGSGCVGGLYAQVLLKKMGTETKATILSDVIAAGSFALEPGLSKHLRRVQVKYLFMHLLKEKRVELMKVGNIENVSDTGATSLCADRRSYLKGLIGKKKPVDDVDGIELVRGRGTRAGRHDQRAPDVVRTPRMARRRLARPATCNPFRTPPRDHGESWQIGHTGARIQGRGACRSSRCHTGAREPLPLSRRTVSSCT